MIPRSSNNKGGHMHGSNISQIEHSNSSDPKATEQNLRPPHGPTSLEYPRLVVNALVHR